MVFLPNDVPSLKNGKIRTSHGIIESKAMRKWRKLVAPYCIERKEEFLKMLEGKSKPYKIGLYFVRKTKHKWDFSNKCASVEDVIVSHGWLEDDNIDVMVPFPLEIDGRYYHVDKSNPGVIITVI